MNQQTNIMSSPSQSRYLINVRSLQSGSTYWGPRFLLPLIRAFPEPTPAPVKEGKGWASRLLPASREEPLHPRPGFLLVLFERVLSDFALVPSRCCGVSLLASALLTSEGALRIAWELHGLVLSSARPPPKLCMSPNDSCREWTSQQEEIILGCPPT